MIRILFLQILGMFFLYVCMRFTFLSDGSAGKPAKVSVMCTHYSVVSDMILLFCKIYMDVPGYDIIVQAAPLTSTYHDRIIMALRSFMSSIISFNWFVWMLGWPSPLRKHRMLHRFIQIITNKTPQWETFKTWLGFRTDPM